MRRPLPTTWTLLALGWACLVWALLTAGDVPAARVVAVWLPPPLLPIEDKLAHLAIFLVQALLLERAAVARLSQARTLLLAVVVCLALGAATELRQRSVPGREADIADFAADALGVGLGAALLPAIRRPLAARPLSLV